jgi:hypothetical protein
MACVSVSIVRLSLGSPEEGFDLLHRVDDGGVVLAPEGAADFGER